MTSMTLKQEAIAPFVRLLETKGMLHSEQFVGMGFHDDKLYLIKLHARPEQVVVRGDDFFFLNKKADGPAFSFTNNQTLQQAAEAYRFYGKDDGTSFTDALMVPQKEMERMMLIASLKNGLANLVAGTKPTKAEILQAGLDSVFTHPDAVNLFQQEDPSITASDVDEARDLLNEAFQGVNQNLAGTPIGEGPALDPLTATDASAVSAVAAAVHQAAVEEPLAAVEPESTVEASPEHRGGVRATMYQALGFKQAYLPH